MALVVNNTQEHDTRIIKISEEVEAFLSSLVARLHPQKTFVTGSCKDGIDNLEKELRFLLTFLWDTALQGCDEHQEFQELLTEFESMANEVIPLLNSSLPQQMHRVLAVLNHIVLIRPKIINFLNLLPSIRISVVCMTPMVSALDSLPIVDSLTCDLEVMMKREDDLVDGEVKGQIKVLYEGLILFKSSIDAVECLQHSEIRELKQILLQIGQRAHEAEYLLISLSIGVAPLWYLSNRLTDINHEIQLIGTQLQQITENYKSGGLKAAKYNFKSPPSLPDRTNTAVDHVMVGFEDNEVQVLDLLVRGAKSLKVISIIGMPGLGKTTLAKKLYNNSLVNYRFDKLSWCVVSQTYLRQSILIDILMQIESAPDKSKLLEMEEERLTECVYRSLKGRRYLIAMDDVWGSDVWDDFRRCFPDDGNGSRILFTSRNKDASPPNNIVYAMPSLSDDQCWELLEKKVFEDNGCPPQLLAIGRKISANCNGLPLVVVVIAGILSTMDREKSTWEQVGGNLASYILTGGDDSVGQILELSYKYLPLYLKPCFLYLATCKEDEEIHARKLMRLWIAEGFISIKKEKRAEDVAEEYLMELIDKSLVMVAKRKSDGRVKSCIVHDLLRDFCLKRCGEENFIRFGDKLGYEKGSQLRVVEGRISKRYCQHVRSIAGPFSVPSNFDVGDLRLVRLLTDNYNVAMPGYVGIEYLVNLRYLIVDQSVWWSGLLELISGLVKLEYLFVVTKKIISLPPAILKMRKLRFLRADPPEIKKLRKLRFPLRVHPGVRVDENWNSSHTTNLEYLSNLVLGDRKDEDVLRCSPHLRKLKCLYPYRLKERMEYRHFDLSFLTQLESLNVVFNVNHMKGISYPGNLKKLTLANSVLNRKEMHMIGRLENLVVLKLRECRFVGTGEDWDTIDGEFQKLRVLDVYEIFSFRQWNVASSQHFPQLQQLVLNTRDLQAIPSEIGEIPTLQLIELTWRCSKSLVESAQEIQKQQLEMGNEDLKIITRSFTFGRQKHF